MIDKNQKNNSSKDPVVYTIRRKSQQEREQEKRITSITAAGLISILVIWFIYCIYMYIKG